MEIRAKIEEREVVGKKLGMERGDGVELDQEGRRQKRTWG